MHLERNKYNFHTFLQYTFQLYLQVCVCRGFCVRGLTRVISGIHTCHTWQPQLWNRETRVVVERTLRRPEHLKYYKIILFSFFNFNYFKLLWHHLPVLDPDHVIRHVYHLVHHARELDVTPRLHVQLPGGQNGDTRSDDSQVDQLPQSRN